MTISNETAASILNFSNRSLFMVIDNPCTGNCSLANDANNAKVYDEDLEQAKQRERLQTAELNCTIEIQKSMNGKLPFNFLYIFFFLKKKLICLYFY